MTTLAKAILALAVFEVTFLTTLVLWVLATQGLDGFLPLAHALGLGIFAWSPWAQRGALLAACCWPLAHFVGLLLLAAWPTARETGSTRGWWR